MRLIQLVFNVTLLLLSSCYQVCTTFVEMDALVAIGKDIVVGDRTYHNAIQIVGEFTGDLSLKLREFDHEKDQDK